MSSSKRYLEWEVRGNPGNSAAVLNRLNAGLEKVDRSTLRSTRNLGLLDKQILAIGTTARYALAGAFVFGVTGAIQKLGEFQAALGQIDALAGEVNKQGQLVGLGDQLSRFGDDALLTSNRVGIAVGDIEKYMTRFYSSFERPRGMSQQRFRAQGTSFTNQIADLATIFGQEGGDPSELAGGIAGFIHGIPGGTKNISGQTRRLSNIIAAVIKQTPNIKGADITRDIARLQAGMTASAMTPEQIFGVYGAAGLVGGSSSQLGQGIAQLLSQGLTRPHGKAQLKAFRQAGLPTDPNQLYQLGGIEILRRMMHAVAPQGAKFRNAAALRDENVSDEDALKAAGLSGVNMKLGVNLFGRVQSFRQFLNLLSVGGPKAIEDFIKSIRDAEKHNLAKQMADLTQNQRFMQQFNEARSNFNLQLVRGAEQPLRALSAVMVRLSNLAIEHPLGTQVVEGAALTGVAAVGLRKLFRNRIARSAVRGGGLGRAGRAIDMAADMAGGITRNALVAEASPNILSGGKTDGTRANPFWVIIHPATRMLGSVTDPVAGSSGGTDTTPGPGFLKKITRKIPLVPLARGAGPVAAAAAAGYYAGQIDKAHGRTMGKGNFPFLEKFKEHALGGPDWEPTSSEWKVIDAFQGGKLSSAQADQRLGRLAAGNPNRWLSLQQLQRVNAMQPNYGPNQQEVQVGGSGEIQVSVTAVDAKGNKIGAGVGAVPVKLWGARTQPTSRGKPRETRRGG